jgi:hypothetical protein
MCLRRPRPRRGTRKNPSLRLMRTTLVLLIFRGARGICQQSSRTPKILRSI